MSKKDSILLSLLIYIFLRWFIQLMMFVTFGGTR